VNYPKNILVAYPYYSDKVEALLSKTENLCFMLDSGAFTAFKSGNPIKFEDYQNFANGVKKRLNTDSLLRIQLDVIGNHEATVKNWERDKSFTPVFTRGTPVEQIENFYKETNYILLGGVAFGENKDGYAKWFMRQVNGRKCHLLGYVNMSSIINYKPTSVDSSSWTSSKRFGTMAVYNFRGGFDMLSINNFVKKPKKEIMENLSKLGFSLSEIKTLGLKASWRGGSPISAHITATSHVMRSIETEKKVGTKIYLACANDIDVKLILDAYKRIESL
jgi:hypothetical protein